MSIERELSRKSAMVSCLLLALCYFPIASYAQDAAPAASQTAPDNSAKNKKQQQTADQQKENTSDREITKKIRQSLMADKSLSTYGHNVKIITQDGAVTLKGPVHSEEEKQAIGSKAIEVAGEGKVTNQLTVKQ